MKKHFTTKFGWSLSLMTLFVFTLLGANIAKAADLQLDTPFKPSSSEKYYFTPKTDGVLKWTVKNGSSNGIYLSNVKLVYTEADTPVAIYETDAPNPDDFFGSFGSWASYQLTGGETYYIADSRGEQDTLTVTWTPTGDTGGGDTGGGEVGGGDTLPAPFDGKLNPDANEKYPFTPSTDGVFKWTVTNDSNGIYLSSVKLLYTKDGEPVEIYETDAASTTDFFNSKGSWASYQLTGGQEYYFQDSRGPQDTFTFEWTPATSGPDTPAGYTELVLGQEYTPTGVGSVMLYYTPEKNVTLTATQTGSTDSYIFSAPFVNPDTNLVPAEDGYTGNNPYTLTYNLKGGETYYIYARTGQYDTVTKLKYAIATSSGNDKVINLEENTVIGKGQVYKYVCNETGILYINMDNYSTSLASLPNVQRVIYSNEGCTQALKALSCDDSKVLKGWVVEVSVTAGTTYYVKNNYDDPINGVPVTFYLTLDAGATVEGKVASVYPAPGALDLGSFDSTFAVTFSPSDITYDGVSVKYYSKSEKAEKVLPLLKGVAFMGGGSLQIPLPQYLTPEGGRNTSDPESSILSDVGGSSFTYVIENVKAGGVAVTSTDVTNGVTISGNDVEITYLVGQAAQLVSANWPTQFYQSYTAGDEAGIVNLVFDKNLSANPKPEVTVIEGRQTYGNAPGENDEIFTLQDKYITISGQTLTLDFTGQTWPSDNSYVTISVQQLLGEDGLAAKDGENTYFMQQVPFVAEAAPNPTPTEVKFLGTDPEDGGDIAIAENGTASFVAKFDGNVKINYAGWKLQGSIKHPATYAPTTGSGEYAPEWTITFSKEQVDAAIQDELNLNCNFQAQDAQGNYVVATENVDNEIWVSFTPNTDVAPGKPFNVTVAEEAEDELNTFTVAADGYYLHANNNFDVLEQINPFESIEITGPNNFKANASSYDTTTQTVTFEPAITESGAYTINFPYRAFTVGLLNSSGELEGQGREEGDQTYWSQAMEYNFNVTITEGVEKPFLASITPENGATIAGFIDGEQVTMSFNTNETIGYIKMVVNGKGTDVFGDEYTKFVGNFDSFNKNENGEWVWNITRSYEFYKGVTYTADITVYDGPQRVKTVGTATVTWEGDSEWPMSKTTVTDYIPALDQTLNLNADGTATFSVKFSDKVTINKVQCPLGQGSFDLLTESDYAMSENNTIITVTIPASIVSNQLVYYNGDVQVAIYATGADGNAVYTQVENNGEQVRRAYVLARYTTNVTVDNTVAFQVYSLDNELIDGKTLEAPLGALKVASDKDSNVMYPNRVSEITVSLNNEIVAKGDYEKYEPTTGTLYFTENLTEAGEYTVYFPEGAFSFGEGMNAKNSAETTVTFTLTAEAKTLPEAWLAAPKDGQERVSQIIVMWGGPENALTAVGNLMGQLTTPSGDVIEIKGKLGEEWPNDEKTFEPEDPDNFYNCLQFNNLNQNWEEMTMGFTEEGEYTVYVPKNTVYVNGVANEDVYLHFVIGETPITMAKAIVLEPEKDFISSMSSLTVTWDFQTVTLSEDADVALKVGETTYTKADKGFEYYLINAQGSEGPSSPFSTRAAEGDNVLVINLPSELENVDGLYTFILSEGTVTNSDGKANPYQELEFNVLPFTTETVAVTPECDNFGSTTVKTLETITLSWGNQPLAVNAPCEIRMDLESGEEIDLVGEGLIETDDENNTLILNVAKITENGGEFNLYVAEDAILIGDVDNLALNEMCYFTFTVTEAAGIINVVDAQDGKYVVYNLNGILVLNTENAAELAGLEAGLYIINGKKVYVRK